MITIDCRDVESIMRELLVYVSDNVSAIPALKLHEFVLSPIDDEVINRSDVMDAIREFLESIGESRNFAVIADADVIKIRSISGKVLERESSNAGRHDMFSCPHCGFVTRYEVEFNTHKVIHYF